MIVHRHAEKSLVALGGKLPVPASVLIQRLREHPAPEKDTAIELCQLEFAYGPVHEATGTNGNSLVAIVRGGRVLTVFLRRTWNQPFTPDRMRVKECVSWHEKPT